MKDNATSTHTIAAITSNRVDLSFGRAQSQNLLRPGRGVKQIAKEENHSEETERLVVLCFVQLLSEYTSKV